MEVELTKTPADEDCRFSTVVDEDGNRWHAEGILTVTREEEDEKHYGKKGAKGISHFYYALKNHLRYKWGIDLIKWRPDQTPGNLTSEAYALRTREPTGDAMRDIIVHDERHQIRDCAEDFNRGEVKLEVRFDIFNTEEQEEEAGCEQ